MGMKTTGIILVIVLVGMVVGAGIVANKDTSSPSNTGQPNSEVNEDAGLAGTQLSGFQPVESVDELEIIDIDEGDGEEVPAGATITADYTGALASTGEIFQSSKDFGEPVQFSLSGVIAGWQQGVPGMKVGGVRRLIIPAELAYGANPPPSSGIPPNAPLVFDIELVSIDQ